MWAKAAIVQSAFAVFAAGGSAACAQGAKTSATHQDSSAIAKDSTTSVRQFVQGFYEWYTTVAVADVQIAPAWKVLSAGRYVDEKLATALRGDSAAAVNRPDTRVTLDFDPFLSGQDRCGTTPKVVDVRRKGPAYRATVLVCIMAPGQTTGPAVDAEVLPVNGHWRITNVFYGEDLDLKSYLCKLAQTDVRPDRRPPHC